MSMSVSTAQARAKRCPPGVSPVVFPVDFHTKWFLYPVHVHFDCAGSHKVCFPVLGSVLLPNIITITMIISIIIIIIIIITITIMNLTIVITLVVQYPFAPKHCLGSLAGNCKMLRFALGHGRFKFQGGRFTHSNFMTCNVPMSEGESSSKLFQCSLGSTQPISALYAGIVAQEILLCIALQLIPKYISVRARAPERALLAHGNASFREYQTACRCPAGHALT